MSITALLLFAHQALFQFKFFFWLLKKCRHRKWNLPSFFISLCRHFIFMFWFSLAYSYRAKRTMPVREGLWARQWECRIDLNAFTVPQLKTMLTGNWAESHLKYCHFAQKPGIAQCSPLVCPVTRTSFSKVFAVFSTKVRTSSSLQLGTVRVILCPFIDCSDLFSVFVCSIGPLNLCPREHIYYCFHYCRLTFKCPLRLVCAISSVQWRTNALSKGVLVPLSLACLSHLWRHFKRSTISSIKLAQVLPI